MRRAYAELLDLELEPAQVEQLLSLVRRFVTGTKRTPHILDLRHFLAEIDHPQASLVQQC